MDELEAFKTLINLTEYAAGQGYEIDRRESSRNCAVMRAPDGDKVIISRDTGGHWIYFSVRDERDHGTIIDFIQNRRRCTLGQVRQALRPWTGEGSGDRPRPAVQSYAPAIEPVSKDRAQVRAEFARMKPVAAHPYLERERKIPAAVLARPRFAGKVWIDMRGNAIFPHYDREGLCGYEIKNRGFTGFAKGGEKGLWFSAAHKGDTALVIAETAIDAISHYVLHPHGHTRYASTGGSMNPSQPGLIRSAIAKMPPAGGIIIATDADPAGRELAAQIEAIAEKTDRRDLMIIPHEPPAEGADWNDILRQGRAPPPRYPAVPEP